MLNMMQWMLLQLVMEEQRFATVMWGGFDFVADAGGSDPTRREWLMECSGLQVNIAKLLIGLLIARIEISCHSSLREQHG